MTKPNIAARVFDTPLLVAPGKAAAIARGLGPRVLGGEVLLDAPIPADASQPARQPFASLLDDRLGEEIRAGRRDAYRVVDGVAVVPITGSLIHRGAWVGSYSGETSYEGIAAQVEAIHRDGMVRGVALEIDSHGGEVAGCFALADQIRKLAEDVPVWAFVADHAYSAAYALASQATRIVLPRTGGAGSIGVICVHADYSRHLEERGIALTIIAAGAQKADGNPYEPLPEDVRDRLADEMEDLRGLFAETVAAGRGARLDADAALATEAGCLLGARAVEAGLADEVANPRDAFERFMAQVNGRRTPSTPVASKKEHTSMADTPEDTETPAANAPENGQAAAPAAPQEAPQAAAAPDAAPSAGGQGNERKRIAAILNDPEAEGREDLARHLALETDTSPEAASAILGTAPKAQPAQSLSAQMDAEATDLDAPAASAAQENPVVAAAKAKYAN